MIHEYPNGRRGIRAFAVYSSNTRMDGAAFVHSRSIRGWLLLEALRARMDESARQALCRACRDREGLFQSLLAESFG
ncbi:MAG: hypothetical protein DYG87_11760 [Anaerolineae bacterium CFX3]|nr:hypothetical protein [Anaerolineae bacterium CFX3]